MTTRATRMRSFRLALGVDLRGFLLAGILAGYGIFILSLFVRNVMTWYINPAYVAPTTLAGAVLIGLAAVAARHGRTHHDCGVNECDGDCGCGTSSHRLTTYALLAVPLLLALLFPPRGLAAFSARQRGPQIAGLSLLHGAATVKRVSLSVDTRSFALTDWVGALSADPNPHDYAGKPVIVTGIVLHSPGTVPNGYFMVMRYFVTCCIADARPVGLIVRDTSHGALQDNQWVTVSGVMGSANDGGQQIAVVNPTRIVHVKADNPYIY